MADKKFLTKDGVKKLENELKELKQELKDTQERLEAAVKQWDLSENAEYESAMEEKVLIENRMSEIRNLLKNAEIIKPGKKWWKVQYGSTVKFKDYKDREFEYTVVGTGEVDVRHSTISFDSPIWKALKNKKKWDKAIVNAPKKEYEIEILEVK